MIKNVIKIPSITKDRIDQEQSKNIIQQYKINTCIKHKNDFPLWLLESKKIYDHKLHLFIHHRIPKKAM